MSLVENLDLVRMFLNILPHHGNYDTSAPFEFHVNDTFSVPFVGTVVSGVVKSGIVHAGDTVLIGPDSTGAFASTKIRTIERKRIGVPASAAGQSASFSLRNIRRKDVRKGMVVLHKPDTSSSSAAVAAAQQPKVYREFVAEVLILSHATTIKTKYQAMLHVGPVSQTCAIIDIDRSYIRTGDRAIVAFRFIQRPEYLGCGRSDLVPRGENERSRDCESSWVRSGKASKCRGCERVGASATERIQWSEREGRHLRRHMRYEPENYCLES